MLDINCIREDPNRIKKDLKKRKDTEKVTWIDKLLKKDEQWKKEKQKLDKLRHKRNELTQAITKKKKAKQSAKKEIQEAKELPKKIHAQEEKVAKVKAQVDQYLLRLPNLMHETVPYGKDDTENQEVRTWGKTTEKKFPLKGHIEVAEALNIIDFERSAKIAGNGFYFLKGDLALLNRALINFAIDHLTKKGYTYVEPPLMMRRAPYEGVTDLDAFSDMLYKVEGEDLHLIATAEHPLTAQFYKEFIEESELPVKQVGYSMCFRKEVGSAGIDTKGLFRTHQFNKVEQIIICKPEDSWKFHEEMIKNAEELFKKLKLPFQVVNICTGDLGIVAAKKYDLNVWMPRQKKYREAVSCSNCTDYQARRLQTTYGVIGGKKNTPHTLNSTAFATSRVLVAILENNQQKNGTVKVPKVLQPYMGGKEYIGG